MSKVMSLLFVFIAILLVSIDCGVIYGRFSDNFDYDGNQIVGNQMKRNRMCLLNAGLSQGCDLSDMLMAKTQANKFMSFAGPGK